MRFLLQRSPPELLQDLQVLHRRSEPREDFSPWLERFSADYEPHSTENPYIIQKSEDAILFFASSSKIVKIRT